MKDQTLTDCFLNALARSGDKPAITFFRGGKVETELTYRELDQDSNQMANTLQGKGIGKGDRVILFLPKSLVGVVVHLALYKMGAVGIPLNPGFKRSEVAYLIQDAGAALVMAGPEQAGIVHEIAPDLPVITVMTDIPYQDLVFFRDSPAEQPVDALQPGDPGLIIYTSGTTGNPKGAILTQGNLAHDANNVIRIWEISERDVLCHALPLFHVHGLCFALHTSLMAGSHILLLDRFSPPEITDLLLNKKGKHVCTIFMAVPPMYVKLTDIVEAKGLDFGHIRLWTSGSAPLLPKDFKRIAKIFGKEPVEREGMTETGMNFSNPVRGVRKPGSIGLALPDLDVRIVDPHTFQDVTSGQEGEIWLKGPAVTPGYWNKPDETDRAFEGGWFRTGDLGKVDEDGYYYLTDRCKNIIISGGENISPKEVEGVINTLEGVKESSVVGVLDEKWGERVVTAVVRKAGSAITPDHIRTHCRKKLHDWKCPKDIVFVDELPRNTMGKVLSHKVKQLFPK